MSRLRRLLRSKPLLLAFLIAACVAVPTVPKTAPEVPGTIYVVEPVVYALNLLHSRLSGHATLGNEEYSVCLLGNAFDRSAVVTGVWLVGMLEVSDSTYTRQECPNSVGGLTVIGAWHNHPAPRFTCHFSIIDTNTFMARPRYLVDLLSCGSEPKLMGRMKTNTGQAVTAFVVPLSQAESRSFAFRN